MQSDYGKGIFNEDDQKRNLTLNRGMSGIFALMFLGLLASAATAYLTASIPELRNLVFGTNLYWLFLLAPLGLVVIAFPRVWKMSAGAAFTLFFFYALINGITLGIIFLVYDLGTITLAFLSAAGMFGVMAIYGAVTKADLTKLGSLLLMGLVGIIIASLLNLLIFRSAGMDLLISYIGIAVFLGLTAYDIQRLRRSMTEYGGNAPAAVMVKGALHLYLDFLNIFLFLLRIMGRRR
ncbi:MAG: Bax inhibitor-1/YccA family protein [Oscillospiraceae bacterium]|nr:Bax inhibitor-1/YccA family protein [Oscillospiraceae bacterium]